MNGRKGVPEILAVMWVDEKKELRLEVETSGVGKDDFPKWLGVLIDHLQRNYSESVAQAQQSTLIVEV